MTNLAAVVLALFASSCALQMSASAGAAKSHCYSDSGVRRCFETEEERLADYRQRRTASARSYKDPRAQRDKAIAEHNEEALTEAQIHGHRLKKWATDPRVAVPVISAIICGLEAKNAAYSADMDRENRITATGGVADLATRRQMAEDLDDNRQAIAEWQERIQQKFEATRVPCSDLSALFACHQSGTCDALTSKQEDLWRNGQDKLDAL